MPETLEFNLITNQDLKAYFGIRETKNGLLEYMSGAGIFSLDAF